MPKLTGDKASKVRDPNGLPVLALWTRRAGPDDELILVAELGPPWYAITGADGRELSDRWAEAVLLKDHVREIWHGYTMRNTDSGGDVER